jgi:pSer/pThr/pTyr-binding forkhead associated (FHA) protein
MKLVFPNQEHGSVLLSPGANKIGSGAENAVVLDRPGVSQLHCVIHLATNGANVQIPPGGGAVTVNGKAIADMMALRSGDLIGIGSVQAKFVAVEVARSGPAASGPEEDTGATRMRMAVPKYVLRGVSGAVFGKVFPVAAPVVIGRAPECDISVPADEISRRHALLKPTQEGVAVEDLGSSNGTYINNKRIQHGYLNPGDELRLDTIRFLMIAPGQEMQAAQPAQRMGLNPAPASASHPTPVPASRKSAGKGGKGKLVPILVTLAAVALIVVLFILK